MLPRSWLAGEKCGEDESLFLFWVAAAGGTVPTAIQFRCFRYLGRLFAVGRFSSSSLIRGRSPIRGRSLIRPAASFGQSSSFEAVASSFGAA